MSASSKFPLHLVLKSYPHEECITVNTTERNKKACFLSLKFLVKTILQIKRIYSFGFQTPIMHLCLGSLCLVLSMVFSTGVDTDKMKNKMSSVCNLISQENVTFIQGSILGLFTYLSVHSSGLYVKVDMLYFSCFMNPHLHFSLFFY